MRRFIRLGLVLALLSGVSLAVFAAGSSEKAGPKTSGIVIGFSNAGMGDSWRQFLVANFNAEVAKHPEIRAGVHHQRRREAREAAGRHRRPAGEEGRRAHRLPHRGGRHHPGHREGVRQGDPGHRVRRQHRHRQAHLLGEQDLQEFGRAQAKWLAEELKGKGKIVMLSGIAGNTTAEDRLRRREGGVQAVPEHPDPRPPVLRLVAPQGQVDHGGHDPGLPPDRRHLGGLGPRCPGRPCRR